MIKLIIFDFDGTLADTKPLLLKLIKKHLENEGYKLNKKFLKEFGDRPLEDALDILGVHEKVLPFLAGKIHVDFIKRAEEARLARNIGKLEEINISKIIISNNTKRFVRALLKRERIGFFHEIYGAEDFESKEEEFKKILKKKEIKSQEVLYVGDRPIDSALARKIGCLSVLVANSASWSSKKDILKSKPDFVISDLDKLKKILSKLN